LEVEKQKNKRVDFDRVKEEFIALFPSGKEQAEKFGLNGNTRLIGLAVCTFCATPAYRIGRCALSVQGGQYGQVFRVPFDGHPDRG